MYKIIECGAFWYKYNRFKLVDINVLVIVAFLQVMEYEQHNKNILSSSGISNKEIQHLMFIMRINNCSIFMKYLYQYILYNIKDDILIDINLNYENILSNPNTLITGNSYNNESLFFRYNFIKNISYNSKININTNKIEQ
ncbi:hypothetical protein H8356DRAFT_1434100 [Neocallimastix lanati (nom. inval.)]|nr:hypothetical protein H8356DRAFT_1434100 [Neocallimastix sp. JGI-2020a]